MTPRVVSTLDGTAWRIRRRWLPHREGAGVRARFDARRRKRAERRRKPDDHDDRWYHHLDVPHGFDEVGIVLIVGVALALVVATVAFGGPVLLIVLDLAWLVVMLLFGTIGRFVLRRPWSVEAVATDGTRREWKVKGYRDAGRLRDALAGEFSRGLDPRPDDPMLSR